MRAVGGNHQIERTVLPACRIGQEPAVVGTLFDARAGADRLPIGVRAMQQREQRTARHAQAETIGRMVAIPHVHHHAAGEIAAVELLDALPAGERLLVQAQARQYG